MGFIIIRIYPYNPLLLNYCFYEGLFSLKEHWYVCSLSIDNTNILKSILNDSGYWMDRKLISFLTMCIVFYFHRKQHNWPLNNMGLKGVDSLRCGYFSVVNTMPCCAKSLQLCLTLCDLMDYSLPGASVHGILQARILEWVAVPSSRGSSWPRDGTHISCSSHTAGEFFTAEPPGKPSEYYGGGGVVAKSCLTLLTPWTVACQAPLSIGFSRQE